MQVCATTHFGSIYLPYTTSTIQVKVTEDALTAAHCLHLIVAKLTHTTDQDPKQELKVMRLIATFVVL